MSELDFDSWEDYKPVSELDLVEKENKNLLKLLKDDKINLLNISKQDFDQMFDNSCEEDYNGDIFMINEVLKEKTPINIWESYNFEITKKNTFIGWMKIIGR